MESITEKFELRTMNDIDKSLIKLDSLKYENYSKLQIIGKVFKKIMSIHKNVTFAYLETRFRYFHTNIFLLPLPKNQIADDIELFYLNSGETPEYMIYICLLKEQDCRRLMEQFGIQDYEEVIIQLRKTGFGRKRKR